VDQGKPLVDGRVDAWIFPVKGTKRWDTCAGEALLVAAGGGWLMAGRSMISSTRPTLYLLLLLRASM